MKYIALLVVFLGLVIGGMVALEHFQPFNKGKIVKQEKAHCIVHVYKGDGYEIRRGSDKTNELKSGLDLQNCDGPPSVEGGDSSSGGDVCRPAEST